MNKVLWGIAIVFFGVVVILALLTMLNQSAANAAMAGSLLTSQCLMGMLIPIGMLAGVALIIGAQKAQKLFSGKQDKDAPQFEKPARREKLSRPREELTVPLYEDENEDEYNDLSNWGW